MKSTQSVMRTAARYMRHITSNSNLRESIPPPYELGFVDRAARAKATVSNVTYIPYST